MSEWKEITTISPPDGEPVLCYWSPDPPRRDAMGVAVRHMGMWHDPDDDEQDYRDPSHWMHLPEPPHD